MCQTLTHSYGIGLVLIKGPPILIYMCKTLRVTLCEKRGDTAMVKDNNSMHVTVTVGRKKKLCEVHARLCDRFIHVSISNFHRELHTYMYIYMYM